MPARNSIIVKEETGEQYEAVALAAIYPGQLVEELSTGKVQKQAVAALPVQKMFAIEDYVQGNEISDVYAATERVFMRTYGSGEEVYAILADGEAAVIGSRLESNGAGELRVQDVESNGTTPSNPEALVAFAREALDVSDSAASALASRRLVVRIA